MFYMKKLLEFAGSLTKARFFVVPPTVTAYTPPSASRVLTTNPGKTAVRVKNMARAIAFYRDTLGLSLLADFGTAPIPPELEIAMGISPKYRGGSSHAAVFGLPGAPGGIIELLQWKFPDCDLVEQDSSFIPGLGGTFLIGWNVPDVKTAYDTLKTRGVKFYGPPQVISAAGQSLMLAFFQDSEGTVLELVGPASAVEA